MATKEVTIQCPKCERTFESKTGLGSHMNAVHGIAGTSKTSLAAKAAKAGKAIKPTQHKCPECGEKFVSGLKLGHHRWMAHKIRSLRGAKPKPPRRTYEKTPDGRFQCPLCAFTGSAMTSMGMHMKMHRTRGEYLPPDSLNSTPTERKELVKDNQNAVLQTNTNNGTRQALQTQDDGNHRLEAAATFAAGRVQELCVQLALQHDVSARTLTALVLRTVAHTSSLR